VQSLLTALKGLYYVQSAPAICGRLCQQSSLVRWLSANRTRLYRAVDAAADPYAVLLTNWMELLWFDLEPRKLPRGVNC
jgi:hypothetical protein